MWLGDLVFAFVAVNIWLASFAVEYFVKQEVKKWKWATVNMYFRDC
jgi:hypothetical protein